MRRVIGRLAVAAILAASPGCGGSPSGSPIPTPIPPPSPTPPVPSPTPVATTTIAINANGQVTPADIQLARGSRVTFVNQHTSPHDMTSDPHPTHTDCPEINQVGNLFSGQSRQTGVFNTARRCGFHDHGEPENGRLQGSITVQ
jgi:plastocyanin